MSWPCRGSGDDPRRDRRRPADDPRRLPVAGPSTPPDLEFAGRRPTVDRRSRSRRTQHPDVLLMDVRMPVLDGIEATARDRRRPGDSVACASSSSPRSTSTSTCTQPSAQVRADFSSRTSRRRTSSPRSVRSRPAARSSRRRSHAGSSPSSPPGPPPAARTDRLLGRLTQREVEVLAARGRRADERRNRGAAGRQPADGEDAREPDPHPSSTCAIVRSSSSWRTRAALSYPAGSTWCTDSARSTPRCVLRADVAAPAPNHDHSWHSSRSNASPSATAP